jgi:hypothetical protein
MTRAAAIGFCALLLALVAAAAFAHAFLESAVPGAGARIGKPPAQLVLTFTAPIEGSSVTVQVFDGAGALVASSKDPETVVGWATITLTLPKLRPGIYRVAWRVDLGRRHVTEGDYSFTVVGSRP